MHPRQDPFAISPTSVEGGILALQKLMIISNVILKASGIRFCKLPCPTTPDNLRHFGKNLALPFAPVRCVVVDEIYSVLNCGYTFRQVEFDL